MSLLIFRLLACALACPQCRAFLFLPSSQEFPFPLGFRFLPFFLIRDLALELLHLVLHGLSNFALGIGGRRQRRFIAKPLSHGPGFDANPLGDAVRLPMNIERDKAAVLLAQARAQYVVIEPGALPEMVAGVNIARYARETTNALGQRVYRRALIKSRFSTTECSKFSSPDDAQRYFLANDGPQKDPLNLDPDGDGFACRWSPDYYRQLN